MAFIFGSKPKKAEYEPSADEKMSASVALAEYQSFKKKYEPMLLEMRDQSKSEDPTNLLRGRANADTMQALTSETSYADTQANNKPSEMSQGLQGQLGVANQSGKDVQDKLGANVLGTSRGQVADAQTGMARASRLATSDALTRAKGKQDVRAAKTKALGQVAGAAIQLGAEKGMFGEAPTAATWTNKPGVAEPVFTPATKGSFGYNFATSLTGGKSRLYP
jgi:hypothetical protein